MKSLNVTIQVKASEQFFSEVLSIMRCEVVLTYDSVGEILKCDHSYERFRVMVLRSESVNEILRNHHSSECH